jgi:hypothetical protein
LAVSSQCFSFIEVEKSVKFEIDSVACSDSFSGIPYFFTASKETNAKPDSISSKEYKIVSY